MSRTSTSAIAFIGTMFPIVSLVRQQALVTTRTSDGVAQANQPRAIDIDVNYKF